MWDKITYPFLNFNDDIGDGRLGRHGAKSYLMCIIIVLDIISHGRDRADPAKDDWFSFEAHKALVNRLHHFRDWRIYTLHHTICLNEILFSLSILADNLFCVTMNDLDNYYRDRKCRHRTKIFRIQSFNSHSHADYINISEITWISLASLRMRTALIYSNNSIYCRLYCVCYLRNMINIRDTYAWKWVKICLKHRMKGLTLPRHL